MTILILYGFPGGSQALRHSYYRPVCCLQDLPLRMIPCHTSVKSLPLCSKQAEYQIIIAGSAYPFWSGAQEKLAKNVQVTRRSEMLITPVQTPHLILKMHLNYTPFTTLSRDGHRIFNTEQCQVRPGITPFSHHPGSIQQQPGIFPCSLPGLNCLVSILDGTDERL